MISSHRAAGSPAADVEDRTVPEEATGGGTTVAPECAGPLTIPADLIRTLESLAEAAGVNRVIPLAICADVLADRLSRPDTPRRARLIQGAREVITPLLADGRDPDVTFHAALRRAADLRVMGVPAAGAGQPVDVTILVSQDGERLYAESMTSAADAPLAQCWALSFLRLLSAAAADPHAPLAAHRLVDDADQVRILHGLNTYQEPDVRHVSLAGPFEEQVRRTPDAVALIAPDGGTVTYRDLNERANRLARFLRDGGVGPDTRVGICLTRSVEQVVAIYATVKAGGGYVPLDAELPDSRLAYMLDDARPRFVLTDGHCRDRIPDGAWQVHDVTAADAPWLANDATDLVATGTGGSLMHILYTSGTTGQPKGVAYPRAGALANLSWMQSRYPFAAGDTALFKTSPGFDVSIWELFWPLYHGARLAICPPGAHRDPRQVARLVERHRVTTIFLAPTVMTPFLDELSPQEAGALRWALCGGEPVTARIRDTLYARFPATTLVNCYGPTEAGNVTDMVVPPDPGSPVVPLGRPAANFALTLFDDSLRLVPVGMPGEAYIGGAVGVGMGYWRSPGRTAERFVADPFGPPGSRMYRTGDLCRYRDDGVLDHLGRVDRQMKVRGQRIEPGEIESVLVADPTIADCAVIAHGDPARILAFVVPTDRTAADAFDATAVLRRAATTLPHHMWPERVIPLLRIPATVNGKIDKAALIHLWHTRGDREPEREIVPPADDLEAGLVEIYGRVLGTAPISVLDTFADLGGHSMLAFKVLDECLARLRAQPAVPELLTGSIRDVAASIRRGQAGP